MFTTQRLGISHEIVYMKEQGTLRSLVEGEFSLGVSDFCKGVSFISLEERRILLAFVFMEFLKVTFFLTDYKSNSCKKEAIIALCGKLNKKVGQCKSYHPQMTTIEWLSFFLKKSFIEI